MAKILLIEDDEILIEQIIAWLKHEQHVVDVVADGKEGLDRLRLYQYDIAVLDWGLPHLAGIEVLKQYRSSGGTIPILMLTGQDKISDKETGLDSGADDYLTKPFNLKELSARLRALLRRLSSLAANVLKHRDIELDRSSRRVTVCGADVKLLPKEYGLLELFMQNIGHVFSPETLLERAWSSESEATVGTVYTNIKTLRKKLAPDDPSRYIKNQPGAGYKLE
jgi:DNA-binding response OmpR family regulator